MLELFACAQKLCTERLQNAIDDREHLGSGAGICFVKALIQSRFRAASRRVPSIPDAQVAEEGSCRRNVLLNGARPYGECEGDLLVAIAAAVHDEYLTRPVARGTQQAYGSLELLLGLDDALRTWRGID